MENKVLVTLNVPSLEKKFDAYIPVNRKIYSVIKMLNVSLYNLTSGAFNMRDNYSLYDEETGKLYDVNVLVRDTDIRNGSKIIML